MDAQEDPDAPHVFAAPPPPATLIPDPSAARGRLVVAVVVSGIVAIMCAASAVALTFGAEGRDGEVRTVALGPFDVAISTELPSEKVVTAALLAIVAIAAVAVATELVAAFLSVNPRRQVLSHYRPHVPPRTGSKLHVTVLVPAHNEEALLPITLRALGQQTRPPDKVVVVADNCTDRTVAIALDLGHSVFESVGNRDRKAGALNQALKDLLPRLAPSDLVMVMDADTSLGPEFLAAAQREFRDNPELAAVGGLFYGDEGHGILGQFQRNEYTRYSQQIRARHGRVFVLTGTASMFRAEVLMDVAAARGVFVPGSAGQVYDTVALTEDNELTLALKSLGAPMVSPAQCRVITEIMPTWRALWVQRKRWQRGALENLAEYGITLATSRYWLQQIGMGYGAIAFALYLATLAISVVFSDDWTWLLFWAVIGLVFVAERTITAWRGGWRARLLAVVLVPELLYAIFLHVVFVKCLFDIIVHRRASWGHVQPVSGGSADV